MSSGNSPQRVRTAAAFQASSLPPRDLDVIRLVDRFHQLESRHIYAARFRDVSDTMLKRCLKRLVKYGYLARFPRYVGGYGGGSGPFVYRVGRQGHRLLEKPGTYATRRAVSPHALGVADYYVTLLEGPAEVLTWLGQEEARISLDGITVEPDARFELGRPDTKTKTSYWLEYDRGTEHNREQIMRKCQRYWHLAQRWQDGVFPYVLFVVPDEQRKRFIERIIDAGPADAKRIFLVQVFQGR